MPECSADTRAVSHRPGAALHVSWFSRYYLPSPLAHTNAHGLLSPTEVRTDRYHVSSARHRRRPISTSISSQLRSIWSYLVGRTAHRTPIISVWFRHCHTAEGIGHSRQALLKNLDTAGLSYASYGRCMRNVPFDDPVLGGSQSEWL